MSSLPAAIAASTVSTVLQWPSPGASGPGLPRRMPAICGSATAVARERCRSLHGSQLLQGCREYAAGRQGRPAHPALAQRSAARHTKWQV